MLRRPKPSPHSKLTWQPAGLGADHEEPAARIAGRGSRSLRAQCLDLRQIAAELKHPGKTTVDATLDEFQIAGLDRLLWIYLRLLYTQFALARFLQKTKQADIQQNISQLDQKLKSVTADAANPQSQRVQKALQDNIETSRNRLANLKKAQDNYELVKLELDRLENKIRSLNEMAVNRQEPEFISGQVDQVASSMVETERTMNDLQFATGLDSLQDERRSLLQAESGADENMNNTEPLDATDP